MASIEREAEAALRSGDADTALKALQAAVRGKPADPKLRVFLFQLLSVRGQWERALTQLDVCAEMDPAAIPMREMYRGAVGCELLRAQVFAGQRSPMLFGEPEGWIALLIEAMLREGRGEADAGKALREQAFEQAPASAGSIDGERFEWIADADMRLGPVLEAIVNGRYYWVPFSRLAAVKMDPPEDLRDFIWMPARLEFINGGSTLALIPGRYAGSESAADGMIALGRKTEWIEREDGVFCGLGQRMFSTDVGDHPLMDVREILFDDGLAGSVASASAAPEHG